MTRDEALALPASETLEGEGGGEGGKGYARRRPRKVFDLNEEYYRLAAKVSSVVLVLDFSFLEKKGWVWRG